MSFGRLGRGGAAAPMSDINMTPLIDVMLVLLVIFIISAPLLASSLRLDLPKSDAAAPSNAPAFIAVALSPAGELYFGEERLEAAAFERRVAEAARANSELEVQLRADEKVAYGRVAELIGVLQKHGLSRIAFVAQPSAGK